MWPPLKGMAVLAGTVLGIAGTYAALAFGLPLIPVSGEPPVAEGTEIFVCGNGIHTDLVLPAETPVMDWPRLLPREHFPDPGPLSSHISFGWGERRFYLETPSWNDLRLGNALEALFLGGATVVHVSYHGSLEGSPRCGRLVLSETQYRRLAAYVKNSFRLDDSGAARPIFGHSYGATDMFYEGEGRYSPILTCNEWTARGLRAAGITVGLWAPFESGVMRYVRSGP
ncbi:MAG: TIGR02117 family protein [Rhodospirillales bacterium]|nr:TIGR02117 family protein [Rhodospirillales bacterium]